MLTQVAAAIMTESPEAAREMAWPMVLQAVPADLQALLSLPLIPLTYHVVLAKPDGDAAKSNAKASVLLIVSLRFISLLPPGEWWQYIAHMGVAVDVRRSSRPCLLYLRHKPKHKALLPSQSRAAITIVFSLQELGPPAVACHPVASEAQSFGDSLLPSKVNTEGRFVPSGSVMDSKIT